MAEQTFKSPGFFEQEIDLSARRAAPLGTPAGVVGTAEKGPAFVPVTLGSFADFESKFGTLSSNRFGPYAVREFLKHKKSITYLRVLGAGANATTSDISTTRAKGTVKNAGFYVGGTATTSAGSAGGHRGVVQFLCAEHSLNFAHEQAGFPVFSDNDSFCTKFGSRGSDGTVNLVRAVLFTTTGSRFEIIDGNQRYTDAGGLTGLADDNGGMDDLAGIKDLGLGDPRTATGPGHFKMVLSCSAGTSFANDEKAAGRRIYTASLDPTNAHYIGKVLNTDPWKFQEQQHLLYLDFAVENELASGSLNDNSVGILSGSSNTTTTGGDTSTKFFQLFGRYDTRYTTPRTPSIISQPYGKTEYDLFHFETISDGAWGNDKLKISIANLRVSTDPNNPYGTFDVQVRKFEDSDLDTQIIEHYPKCTLDPSDGRYIARQIGDKKVYYNFDADEEDERRLVIQGKYPNRSNRVRCVMNSKLEEGEVPKEALPFGFRGVPVLKTSNTLTDVSHTALSNEHNVALGVAASSNRLACSGTTNLTGSIVPPLPFRFKVTRGAVNETHSGYVGQTGTNERVDTKLYWGVKFERMPVSSSDPTGDFSNSCLDSNVSQQANPLINAYAKFNGIAKLDTVVTGGAADNFNNNKFTLARVALFNQLQSGHISHVSGTAKEHMLEAAYIRNGRPDPNNYTVNDPNNFERITLATIVHSSSTVFNRFTDYAKFSTMFYGGFDGLNILDKDNHLMRDRATSMDTGGKATTATPDIGLFTHVAGDGRNNNSVSSYKRAAQIMTDPLASRVNILAIPGIRDSFVTDHVMSYVKDYGMAIYLMDLLNYDVDATRLFDDSKTKVNVQETSEQLESRALDNNYTATYFPDVHVNDPVNNRNVKVPASVVALGALAYNDKVSFPWFAPAGFNRGALDNVKNVSVRLNATDRDDLYTARVNPIAVFPNGGHVIFGQKTLQQAKSALDRVNVRRLLLEVKRLIVGVARGILFEQNTPETRSRFVNQVAPLLALVQAQAGVESFRVVCDDTNNSEADREVNKLNGRIVIVPTRSIEFIAIDFIITNSGVSFE